MPLTITGSLAAIVLAGNTPVLVHNDDNVIIGPNGERLPGIPRGVTGTVTNNGQGLTYQLPGGTEGIDSRVTQMRVMNPNAQNPNGYVVYMNKDGQTVNPTTGRTTIGKSDPYAHIGLKPGC